MFHELYHSKRILLELLAENFDTNDSRCVVVIKTLSHATCGSATFNVTSKKNTRHEEKPEMIYSVDENNDLLTDNRKTNLIRTQKMFGNKGNVCI